VKIGILTFQWAVNYGAVLQMYALKTFLEKNGDVKVDILNFTPKELSSQYSLNIFSKGLSYKHRILRLMENIVKRNQYNKFSSFLDQNFNLTKLISDSTDLKETVKEYDLIIVGSDQVWNSEITKEYLTDYLLYGYDCNKVSYAASFGSESIPNEIIGIVKDSLKDFEYISIREKNSIDYLKNIIENKKLSLVLDPVFLLTNEEWSTLSIDAPPPKENYILLYMLEYNPSMITTAKTISKSLNLPVYSIEIPFIRFLKDSEGIKKMHNVGPKEFIALFKNASYVLTNSFHGTSFSLLFEKEFISFTHPKRNLRMKNLMEIYGLEDNQIYYENIPSMDIIKGKFEKCSDSYNSGNPLKNNYISLSNSYLNNAINHFKSKS
jgi:hypothetical protein